MRRRCLTVFRSRRRLCRTCRIRAHVGGGVVAVLQLFSLLRGPLKEDADLLGEEVRVAAGRPRGLLLPRARELGDQVTIGKVNVDAHPGLAHRFDVTGIPNFVVLKGGRVVQQQAGFVPHTRMEEWLRSAGA